MFAKFNEFVLSSVDDDLFFCFLSTNEKLFSRQGDDIDRLKDNNCQCTITFVLSWTRYFFLLKT